MRKRAAVGALGLGDLILVVREDEVKAAGVDVDGRAEVFVDHSRALDMPAGTSLAPAGIPVRLAFFFRLPEYEI